MKFNKYFDSKEFDSPDKPDSGKDMNLTFIEKLTMVRKIYNKPIIITSGLRTIKHNKEVGGKDNSAHLRGHASDISIANSNDRYLLLKALYKIGFNRIGVAKTFIHVDDDISLPQNVLWPY